MKTTVLFATFLLANVCWAQDALDQQNLLDTAIGGQGIGRFSDINGSPDPDGDEFDLQDAQTFTVGITGFLTRIRVPLVKNQDRSGNSQPVVLEIRRVTGSVPGASDSNVVASASVSAAQIPSSTASRSDPAQWPEFNFVGQFVQLNAGEVWSFSVRSVDTVGYLYNPELNGNYNGGAGWRRNQALTDTWGDSGRDFGFQTFMSAGGPIEWRAAEGGNGHFYHYVLGTRSWTSANAAAQAGSFMGTQGHLVTITSNDENAFVRSLPGKMGLSDLRAWIGLTDDAVEGDYRWVTGEAFSYANWSPGEPTGNTSENSIEIFASGRWNDNSGFTGFNQGYVVEYDINAPPPEPALPPEFSTTTLVLPADDPDAQAISCGSSFEWARGREVVIEMTVNDGNSGDTVTVTATLNGGALPADVAFAQTGGSGNSVTYRLTWTPDFDDDTVDQAQLFEFTATDGNAATANATCQITVDVKKDRDGDSIPDLWELEGVPGVGDTDPCHLPSLGADVNQRDLLIEVDYIAGQRPSTQAMDKVKAAFAAYGINLLVCIDDEIPATTDLEELGSGAASSYAWRESTHPSGAVDHFDELKDTYFDPAVARIFRYCIFANNLPGGASGVARGNGSQDFIVALGSFSGGVNEEAGTFMHELGHTLGLTHGGQSGNGQADLAWKPNYSSVMSYWYQRFGVGRDNGAAPLANDPLGRTSVEIDFSPFALPELDERALNEGAGLGPDAAGYRVRWMCSGTAQSQSDGSLSIDWNCNGGTPESGVPANVSRGLGPSAIDNNFQPAFGAPGGTPGLLGHDDWSALDFSGGGIIGAGDSGPPPVVPDVTPIIELDVATATAIKPPAPTGLVARGGRRSVRMRWNTLGPLGDFAYNVYRSQGGGAPALIGTTAAAGFIDRRPARGVLYTYQIAVVDTLSGESLLSVGAQASSR